MRTFTAPVFAAALLGGTLATTAYAMPVPGSTAAPVANSAVELAQSTRDPARRANQRYDRRLHGDRCRIRGNKCRYQRDGWWYTDRWWLAPAIVGGVIIGSQLGDRDDYYDDRRYDGRYNRRHVDWCLDRYRSYNPRTNLWLSYSGNYRHCVSPYS